MISVPSAAVSDRPPDQLLVQRPLWLRLTILNGGLALLFSGEVQIFRGLPSQVSSSGLGADYFTLVMAVSLVRRSARPIRDLWCWLAGSGRKSR